MRVINIAIEIPITPQFNDSTRLRIKELLDKFMTDLWKTTPADCKPKIVKILELGSLDND